MLAYAIRRSVAHFLAVFFLLICAGCAGGAARLGAGESQDSATSGGRTGELHNAMAEISGAVAPVGVDPALFDELKRELLRTIAELPSGHVVSAPPAGAANATSDLTLAGSDAAGYSLEWTYVSTGDYNRDGEVNISDLTPLGMHYLAQRSGPYWDESRVADGNGDGEVNISDITPIGQNYGTQIAGFEIFSSTTAADYPADPDGANGPGALSLGTVEVASGAADYQRRLRFSFPLVSAGQAYWVRPYFGGLLGVASNLVDLSLQLDPDTVVLDSESALQLSDFSGGVLTFTSSTAQLAGLTAGKILVSGPLSAAPSGLLHRVDNVSGSGPVTVAVTPADLSDALLSGAFSITIPLRVQDVKSTSSAVPGLSWEPGKQGADLPAAAFFLPFNDVPVGSGVTLSGNILLVPSLVMNLKFGSGVVQQLDFGANCHVSGGLTVEGDAAGTWADELPLHTWTFLPIIIQIGVFPIVIEPSINAIIGSSGNCTLQFSASVAADAYIEGTLGYKDGSWGPHKDYGADFSAPDPEVYGAVHCENYMGAKLNLDLYGLKGGYGKLTTGFKVDADVTADPWWTICAGVRGVVGIDMLLISHEEVLFDECWLQTDAGGPFVAPPALSSWAVTLDHAETADYDNLFAVLPLADGGVIAAGDSFLFPIFIRIDALGNVVWQREFSEPGEIRDLAFTPDGGIIGVGMGAGAAQVFKLTLAGELVWARSLSQTKSCWLENIEPLVGGGYLAVGSYITDAAVGESWALRLNEDGSVRDSTMFGTSGGDNFISLTRNPDGSFFAAGQYGPSGTQDAWLARFDANGAAEWHKRLWISSFPSWDYSEWATGVAADGSGGCYITGQTNRSALSLWAVRYSPAGHGWVRVVLDEDFAITWDVTDIVGLRNGGFAVCGQTGTAAPNGARDGFITAFSSGGGLAWAAAYGGSLDDGFSCIAEKLVGSGLFAAGLTQSFRTDNEQDAWTLLLRPGGTAAFTPSSGAGRSYMSGNVKDDEDLTEHYQGFTPTVQPASVSAEQLSGTLADYGSTPTNL